MESASIRLETAGGRGLLTGFGNLVDKEYGTWWRTRRALLHNVLWLSVINGILLLIGLDEMGRNPYQTLEELTEIFFRMGGFFAAIGIVVSTQGSVLGERKLGTAEWVLSKPVTREAFVLSKLVVNGASFLGLAVLIPSVVFFLQTLLLTYLQPNLGPFLLGSLLNVEHLIFYLALTLALSSWLSSRGAVSGVAIGFMFAGFILPGFLPWLLTGTPWALSEFAATAARGRPLPAEAWQPIVVTLLWTALLVLVALWRFEREEF
ncbi:MAG: ABC transporter permease subunit [Gemmatimonadetes bacterium]|nr:ABC transporter permease subunit [Gemmatimonadota bacterium]NIO30645.1 ABC transporter permease subunit [Gemmatimonadota bacterium]